MTQPELSRAAELDVEWVFARDGAMTAMQAGKWWGGCSVPQAAAEELLRTLEITGGMACFLAPAHAAQISFALRAMRPEQALIVVLPGELDLAIALHCEDFADEIAAHRLWFAAGEAWADQLAALFRRHHGLVIPQQFIRTTLLVEDASAAMISAAQSVFSNEAKRRTDEMACLRSTRRASVAQRRVVIAAPMRFRLWEDASRVLGEVVREDATFEWGIVNFDDPLTASPMALAEAAGNSDAVITANLTRPDCASVLHPDVPLISWLTDRKSVV